MTAGKLSPLDFQFCECIGEGSYSKVYKGVYLRNHRTYAVKVLSKAHIQRENKRKYVNIEKNTMSILGRHPGIVTLYYTFQDSKSLYFVIDMAKNGELLSLIQRLGSLSEQLSRYYMIQLVDALEFVHSKEIIHRDLKPENILLTHDWKLMITDFGAAKILKGGEGGENGVEFDGDDAKSEGSSGSTENCVASNGSFVGTAEYVSPELLKHNVCGFEGDLWALGCIAYQMIVGRPPFKGATEYETFEKIVGLEYSFPVNYFVPEQIKDLVKNLLVTKPEERYTIEDVKHHIWFKGVNWEDKDSIWATQTPKLEPYNPKRCELNYRLRHSPRKPMHLTPGSLASVPGYYMDPGGMDGLPKGVLRAQIKQSQSNMQLLNRVAGYRPGQPLPQPLLRPLPQPLAQPLPQPLAQPLPQPLAQPLPQPLAQPEKPKRSPQLGPPVPSRLIVKRNSLEFASSESSPSTSRSGMNGTPIDSTLASRKVPSSIINRLTDGETIIKLDNIFMSELTHRPNQFVPPGKTLTDVILNNIITDNYHVLNKDIKLCILVITSKARLFIYEICTETRPPAKTFYSRMLEIKLNSKTVSMYDYEFDEELKEGYLILELKNINKLIFLSAYNPETSIHGGIKVGFKVSEKLSWIDALMKAKQLLKNGKRQVQKQSKARHNYKRISHASPQIPSRNLVEGMRKMRIKDTSKDAIAAAAAAAVGAVGAKKPM
ncbi:hypothetical protein FOA43_001832 [Brettanomyces nanus]|uniref:non-specific serine/threonine protein kinase n=1 Tax=Eeniella nana TaxID=13502 RepID=A0A875S368_EENNA|nr:uncharacterized protein FOA43_001832 [Brettanomyces nanus]QPG74502.1 hypothetical protein FOA43_001832 [Brettanomyces nanus]